MTQLENVYIKNVLFYLPTMEDVVKFAMISKNCQLAINTIFINPFMLSETTEMMTICKFFPNLQTLFLTKVSQTLYKKEMKELPIIECGNTSIYGKKNKMFSTIWFPLKVRKITINSCYVLSSITENIKKYSELQEVSIRTNFQIADIESLLTAKKNQKLTLYYSSFTGDIPDINTNMKKHPSVNCVFVLVNTSNSELGNIKNINKMFKNAPPNVKYYVNTLSTKLKGVLMFKPIQWKDYANYYYHRSINVDTKFTRKILVSEIKDCTPFLNVLNQEFNNTILFEGHNGNQIVGNFDTLNITDVEVFEKVVIYVKVKKITTSPTLKGITFSNIRNAKEIELPEIDSGGCVIERFEVNSSYKLKEFIFDSKYVKVGDVKYTMWESLKLHYSNTNDEFNGIEFFKKQVSMYSPNDYNSSPFKDNNDYHNANINFEVDLTPKYGHLIVSVPTSIEFHYCDEHNKCFFEMKNVYIEYIPKQLFIVSYCDFTKYDTLDISCIKEEMIIFHACQFVDVVFNGSNLKQSIVFLSCELESLTVNGTMNEKLVFHNTQVIKSTINNIGVGTEQPLLLLSEESEVFGSKKEESTLLICLIIYFICLNTSFVFNVVVVLNINSLLLLNYVCFFCCVETLLYVIKKYTYSPFLLFTHFVLTKTL